MTLSKDDIQVGERYQLLALDTKVTHEAVLYELKFREVIISAKFSDKILYSYVRVDGVIGTYKGSIKNYVINECLFKTKLDALNLIIDTPDIFSLDLESCINLHELKDERTKIINMNKLMGKL